MCAIRDRRERRAASEPADHHVRVADRLDLLEAAASERADSNVLNSSFSIVTSSSGLVRDDSR